MQGADFPKAAPAERLAVERLLNHGGIVRGHLDLFAVRAVEAIRRSVHRLDRHRVSARCVDGYFVDLLLALAYKQINSGRLCDDLEVGGSFLARRIKSRGCRFGCGQHSVEADAMTPIADRPAIVLSVDLQNRHSYRLPVTAAGASSERWSLLQARS